MGCAVTPPGDLDAEMALVGMACVLGPDAPPAIWQCRPADFVDPRHRDLWAIAQRARWRKAAPAMDALFAVATPRYLGEIAIAYWPADVAALVAAVRDAAVTRRLLDAATQLAHAWADDDKARWRAEIVAISAAGLP